MEPRMKNPAMVLNTTPAIQQMMGSIYQSGISTELLEYVGLRVGQMNSCELCVGESIVRSKSNPAIRDRVEYVLDWRRFDVFSEQERTALELAEDITTLDKKYDSRPLQGKKVKNNYVII